MLKSPCLFLCLCYFVVGAYSSGNLVPFIDKCEWSDKACLVASTTKALPHFSKGMPQLGLESMDPLKMAKVTLKEGGLRVDLTDMDVTGISKCKILKVERDITKKLLTLEAECPFDVVGQYDCDGNLLSIPVEGKGPFHFSCESIFIAVEVGLTTEVGKDGAEYWKVGKATHTYEGRKQAKFNFENLFNGDEAKAQPILRLFNENWKVILHTVAKPVVSEMADKIIDIFRILCSTVPADQLEKKQ